jgi:hypothetical protein
LVRKLNVNLMSVEEIDQAFPLVRTLCPAAELEGWRRFARQRLSPDTQLGTGILIVRNEQGCIVGLGAYTVTCDLLHGPILLADHFCALDIIDPENVARALEGGIERTARRHGCTAVHTTVASDGQDDGWLCAVLHERGHRVEGLHMCKLIPTLS